MSRSPLHHAVRSLLILLLLTAPAGPAGARVAEHASGRDGVPAPVHPLDGERVAEGTARLEVSPGARASGVRVVIARFAFDPSGWKSLPSGPAWTIVPYAESPIPLEPLTLADRRDTRLWWAVVWTDLRTGGLHASEVREFTLEPRFSNRIGPDGGMRPSATGRLPEHSSMAARPAGPRRTIQLAAGYALIPGEPGPSLPAGLKRERVTPPGAASTREAYLVQFADASPDSARARIANAGGKLVWSMSGDGYLVRMESAAVTKLREAGGDAWIAPYEPAYKLSPAIDRTMPGPVKVTALLFADGDGDAAVAALRALGATDLAPHRGELNHLVRFELDRARIVDAAALADVAWIEPTPEFAFSNDQAQWVVQSGVPESRPVTDHGLRGQGQVVMTCDSGIRANHELFNDSTQAISDWGDYPTHRKIIAYKPGSNSPFVSFGDDLLHSYHGTHTAGTVAGNPNPFSSAPWSGVAPDARLYFMDVSGPVAGGLQVADDLNDLYQPSYTGNAGGAARISSNSWGAFTQAAYTLSSMQTDQFVWNHPDYLLAFASGNIGIFAAVNAPGTAKNCLTVGATGNGTAQNSFAPFSSRGPTADGRRKPTVLAPGEEVISAYASTRYTYAAYSGTSMATPAVAGAMALVRQYLTEGWYPTGAPIPSNAFVPSAALLRAMAVTAGRNDVSGFRVPDNTIGYGRLTIDDVLYFPGDSSRTLLVDSNDGLSDKDFVEYQVQVTDPVRPLKIALCWTDAPGNPASTVQIVNDLDLIVTHEGDTYRGNFLLNYGSVPGGTRDSLNVEEIFRVATPAVGLWTVRIEAHRIVEGPQRFALCITGGVGGPRGAIALDRFQYGLDDTLEIEVIDSDASGPITALVSSGTELSTEPVTLEGSNGVFRGSIPIAPVLVQIADGVLAVSTGDLVTATYTDASSGAAVAATARVNVQAPTITDVHATGSGSTHALITWTTDLGSSSRVRFGANGTMDTFADSAGHTTHHAVLLTGLEPATTYRYEVESMTPGGDVSRDSLGGAYRSFTTRRAGSIALLMDDPSASVLDTWSNAVEALGWDMEVLPAAMNDPPLVGNSSAGLRRYDAVLWQVDPNKYPPFSDAQRAAIDSLLDGGGRLLVTGHDIGYGLSDAGVHSYTLEREEWLESTLKSRYYFDNFYADTLTGIDGNPVSGAFTGSVPYMFWMYPDSGDNIGPVPGIDGTWSADWLENFIGSKYMGMHWESGSAQGTPGAGVWGGESSRLVGMFYEWRALAGSTASHLPARTGVLRDAVSWLLGHRPPEVHMVLPAPATVVTSDFVAIKYSIQPDLGRAIAERWLDYSLDGGETWSPVTTAVCADSGCVWDVGGVLLGGETSNSTGVMLRVRVRDDGSPGLHATAAMSGPFTIARPTGDSRGPALVAGSGTCSPLPIRRNKPAALFATFSDVETGGGTVAAAEYSVGEIPAPPGGGTAMSGTFGGATAAATAALATQDVLSGERTFWVRGRDAAGNWGTAAAVTVPTSGSTTVGVEDAVAVDFLGAPSPNPFHGSSAFRFGLARTGEARLDLFDLAGRRVRTLASGILPAGSHVARWDGRDHEGNPVRSGVYFARLTTPSNSFRARVVALR